jgi:uncharacterized protein YaaQ
MKKVGIVADDYKVIKFKSELTKNGFTDFQTHPFTKGNTSIIVMVADDKVNDVYRICKRVELHFKRSN